MGLWENTDFSPRQQIDALREPPRFADLVDLGGFLFAFNS